MISQEAAMLKFPLFALAFLAGGTAFAQAPAAPQQQNTRAEVQKMADGRFGEGDVNNDGFLSRDELQGMTAKATQQVVAQMEQQFTAMDTDKNGQVSLAEFKAAATAKVSPNAEAALQRFDANKDGKVSATEFRAPVLATFDQVDANKDGIVTQDEARKSATTR
jgi:Ca2+-binding EF-hand superfamily protein